MRAVVCVATHGKYIGCRERLRSILARQGETFIAWGAELPPGSPSHQEKQFAFKFHAIREALRMGYSTILWADSSIIPLRPLTPLWELIEAEGYWFSMNLPWGKTNIPPWSTGAWTCDAALEPLGITREESFQIPHVIGTAFGLNLRFPIAQQFLKSYGELAEGTAFCGPTVNNHGEASADRRVLGHRHDQTAASVLAYRLGMKLTTPPTWIVDGIPATQETILEIRRHDFHY
jgi:hypothetical protein